MTAVQRSDSFVVCWYRFEVVRVWNPPDRRNNPKMTSPAPIRCYSDPNKTAIQIWEEGNDPIKFSFPRSALKRPSPQLSRQPVLGQHVTLAARSHDAFHLLPQLGEWGLRTERLRERERDAHGSEHLPVSQPHNKLLANAGVRPTVLL